MKNFCFFVLLSTFFSSAYAEGRIGMVGPSEEEEAVKDLLSKISESCSRQDFRGFMDCFTQKRAASIRKTAENAFICGRVDMEVLDHFVISSDEGCISFGLRYVWTENDNRLVFCSKIVAKKQGDSWQIDSEQVKSSRSIDQPSYSNDLVKLPAPRIPEDKPANAGGGGWRHPNPANGGEEAWLPKDILYTPGPSCANGNCRR